MTFIAQQSAPSGSTPFQQPQRHRTKEFAFGDRMRKLSQHKPRSNGKNRENVPLGSSMDTFASGIGSVSLTNHGNYSTSRPSTADSSPRFKRSRGSILVQASDVLNSTFGRRRKPVSLPPGPIILPGVMEISAPRRDDEVEERERLRDAAAQSLGLGPDILPRQSQAYSINEVDEDVETTEQDGGFEMFDPSPSMTRSVRSGSVSSRLGHSPSISGRQRAGSYTPSFTHTRTRSTTPATAAPSFPSTPSTLQPSASISATFPKYHAPSSLLIYALSKQWKARYVVLSSPPTSSRTRAPLSYLHVFKSAGPEERELERLEINEESVIFVADEEVGGRGGVVKVGGIEIGSNSKERDDGRTMWLLQIADATEAQRWIAAIKTAILGQRSMRAGLGIPPQSPTGNEPRGDMDVMLTMRAQGILSSPTPRRGILPEFGGIRSRTPSMDVPETSRSSPLSMQSHAATITSQSSGAVSTIKGLFAGANRTRSSSRATMNGQEATPTDGSFGAMGSNLMGLSLNYDPVEMNATTSNPRTPTTPTISSSKIVVSSVIASSSERIEHQRQRDAPNVTWATPSVVAPDRQNREPLAGMAPLQPPPHRKLSTAHASKPSVDANDTLYQHSRANDSVADNFGVQRSPSQEMVTLPLLADSTPTATTFGSPAAMVNHHRFASSSTSFEGEQRTWSRQIKPQRLSPPNGPRPAPSTRDRRTSSEDRQTSWLQTHHPYAMERSSSPSSSNNSPLSAMSGPHSSTKRESNSSVSTASTSHSRFSMSRQGGSHRRSVPPPAHPAPNVALPATPTEVNSPPADIPRPSKVTFRNSVAQRAIRMSLSAPKPPPSTSLPPRPDEKLSRHRRSTSNGSILPSTDLQTIPASSILPDVSSLGVTASQPSSPISPSRHTSLKQRLRILSAPSSTPSIRSLTTSLQNLRSATPPITNIDPWVSQPSTPIGEPITSDPNFVYFPDLELEIIPRAPTPEPPPSSEIFPGSPEIMALSPPPRRGSRHASMLERQRVPQVAIETPEGPARTKEVTRSTPSASVISLVKD